MTAEAQRRYKERHPERVAAGDRRYVGTVAGRATRRAAQRAWKLRNVAAVREHSRIMQRVRYHVSVGHLSKTPCMVCGANPVHAHHHNGYDPGHELDVVWLCSIHHSEAHRWARDDR